MKSVVLQWQASSILFLRQISFENGETTVEDEIKKAVEPVFACKKRMKEIEEQKNERNREIEW